MVINLSTLNLKPRDDEQFVTRTSKGSAFQKAAVQGVIDMRGTTKRGLSVPDGQDFSVPEGAKKPGLNAEFSERVVMPSKKAFTVVVTEESEQTLANIATLFVNFAPGLFAREFDLNVAGLQADKNGRIKSLQSTTVTEEVTIASAADLKAALGAYTTTGELPDAWVLSTALYGELIALDATESDRKLSSDLLATGQLLGAPVHTFRSPERIGFLRNFEMDEWAIVGGDVEHRRVTAGPITDYTGQVHNLAEENKIAHILEGHYSYYAAPENETIILRSATDVDPEA